MASGASVRLSARAAAKAGRRRRAAGRRENEVVEVTAKSLELTPMIVARAEIGERIDQRIDDDAERRGRVNHKASVLCVPSLLGAVL